MSQAHILLVEDDPAIRQGLVDTLESEHYQVSEAADGTAGAGLLSSGSFDLVILDVMMPGKSGYDLCREFRKKDSRTPVLMLTAKSEEIDKVVGLELGADDYMTKPFGVRELLARVHALLRRAGVAGENAEQEELMIGSCRLIPRELKGRTPEGELDFSAREMELLQLFATHPNEVFSRDELLNRIWGVTYYGTTRTLDQHIAQLRKKIEPDRKEPRYILTVHGVGYRYCPK